MVENAVAEAVGVQRELLGLLAMAGVPRYADAIRAGR
jgi:hypothetical protein